MPVALARSTARAVMFSATGGTGAFPAPVAALATGAMRAMFLSKLTFAVVLGLTATGAAVHAFQREGAAPADNVPLPPVQEAGQDRQQAQNPYRPAAEPPAQTQQQSPGQNSPMTRPGQANDYHRDIQLLSEEAHRLLLSGRYAEAEDVVSRLSNSARLGNGPSAPLGPSRT